MKPYPVYKDSGIEWLGEIPKEWKLDKIKHNVSIYKNQSKKSIKGFI